MAYEIKHKDPAVSPIIVPDRGINTNAVDVPLYGRGMLEYGEHLNESMLHLLENFALPAQSQLVYDQPIDNPLINKFLNNPTPGQTWFNKTRNSLFVYADTTGSGYKWMELPFGSWYAANWGVITDGMQLPRPVNRFGYVFSYEECTWSVSPRTMKATVAGQAPHDWMLCTTTPGGLVTSKMRYVDDAIQPMLANFLIVGIRYNNNVGVACTKDPTPCDANIDIDTDTPSIVCDPPCPPGNTSISVSLEPRGAGSFSPDVLLDITDAPVDVTFTVDAALGTPLPLSDYEWSFSVPSGNTIVTVDATTGVFDESTFTVTITPNSELEIGCTGDTPPVCDTFEGWYYPDESSSTPEYVTYYGHETEIVATCKALDSCGREYTATKTITVAVHREAPIVTVTNCPGTIVADIYVDNNGVVEPAPLTPYEIIQELDAAVAGTTHSDYTYSWGALTPLPPMSDETCENITIDAGASSVSPDGRTATSVFGFLIGNPSIADSMDPGETLERTCNYRREWTVTRDGSNIETTGSCDIQVKFRIHRLVDTTTTLPPPPPGDVNCVISTGRNSVTNITSITHTGNCVGASGAPSCTTATQAQVWFHTLITGLEPSAEVQWYRNTGTAANPNWSDTPMMPDVTVSGANVVPVSCIEQYQRSRPNDTIRSRVILCTNSNTPVSGNVTVKIVGGYSIDNGNTIHAVNCEKTIPVHPYVPPAFRVTTSSTNLSCAVCSDGACLPSSNVRITASNLESTGGVQATSYKIASINVHGSSPSGAPPLTWTIPTDWQSDGQSTIVPMTVNGTAGTSPIGPYTVYITINIEDNLGKTYSVEKTLTVTRTGGAGCAPSVQDWGFMFMEVSPAPEFTTTTAKQNGIITRQECVSFGNTHWHAGVVGLRIRNVEGQSVYNVGGPWGNDQIRIIKYAGDPINNMRQVTGVSPSTPTTYTKTLQRNDGNGVVTVTFRFISDDDEEQSSDGCFLAGEFRPTYRRRRVRAQLSISGITS